MPEVVKLIQKTIFNKDSFLHCFKISRMNNITHPWYFKQILSFNPKISHNLFSSHNHRNSFGSEIILRHINQTLIRSLFPPRIFQNIIRFARLIKSCTNDMHHVVVCCFKTFKSLLSLLLCNLWWKMAPISFLSTWPSFDTDAI